MIALDTGFLIYGTQNGAGRNRTFSEVQLARVSPTVEILEQLRVERKPIIIPAPAAWEYVLDFAVTDQPEIWRGFSPFSIVPFDAAAARIAAQISRRFFDRVRDSTKGHGKRQVETPGARQQMKVDIQIVSIAIAQRAEAIYTLEVEKFSEWAGGMIDVIGLPRSMSA